MKRHGIGIKKNSMADHKNRYSIVVPIYNEQETLPELNRRLIAVMREYGQYEILYVDDGSTDRSKVLIDEYCNQNSGIALLSFSRNFGHQAAITAGLAYATGDVVAVMDGDLQDPPEILWELFEKWHEGYKVSHHSCRKSKSFW